MNELQGKRAILKSLIRSEKGYCIGTKEHVGILTPKETHIIFTIDEGSEKGNTFHLPIKEIYISIPRYESYVLGGTGIWEKTTELIKVDDADVIIEWETIRTDYIKPKILTDEARWKQKSLIETLKKDADVFGIAEASRILEQERYRIKNL